MTIQPSIYAEVLPFQTPLFLSPSSPGPPNRILISKERYFFYESCVFILNTLGYNTFCMICGQCSTHTHVATYIFIGKQDMRSDSGLLGFM